MLSLLLHPGLTRVPQFPTHRYTEPVTLLVTVLIAFANMLIYSFIDYTLCEKELEKNVRNAVLSLPMTIIYSFILLYISFFVPKATTRTTVICLLMHYVGDWNSRYLSIAFS